MKRPDIHNISVLQFTYNLPDDKIAKYPLQDRDKSKLLVWKNGGITDSKFTNISDFIPEKSLLVFNNTKVIRARMQFRKKTGAKIEIFCLEPHTPEEYTTSFAQKEKCSWKCIVGNLKKWKGEVLENSVELNGETVILKAERKGTVTDAHEILFSWDNKKYTFSEILDASGSIPIPPYLNRESEEEDSTRYQTVYSKIKGSVAAPTAGLHFTDAIFKTLSAKNIEKTELTLHVGAGTFKPVKSETIGEHDMHTEHIIVNKTFINKLLEHPNKVIAVGTTSVRTLESLYWIGKKILDTPDIAPSMLAVSQWEPYNNNDNPSTEKVLKGLLGYMENSNLETLNSSTQIIILPGYDFKIINGMFTNFHQPQSTLLLLVSAFIGDNWKEVYKHALSNEYRFLSYGDSNLYFKEGQ
jgi:S-adenosylmethionine:tRNA ribosyltransferase-isomerase